MPAAGTGSSPDIATPLPEGRRLHTPAAVRRRQQRSCPRRQRRVRRLRRPPHRHHFGHVRRRRRRRRVTWPGIQSRIRQLHDGGKRRLRPTRRRVRRVHRVLLNQVAYHLDWRVRLDVRQLLAGIGQTEPRRAGHILPALIRSRPPTLRVEGRQPTPTAPTCQAWYLRGLLFRHNYTVKLALPTVIKTNTSAMFPERYL